MLDIATYDDADRAAMIHCGHWATIRAMRPEFFATQGFPTRIERLAELRYLFDAMSKWDSGPVLREMRGARPEDVSAIAQAAKRFIDLHRTLVDREPVRVPLGTLAYKYLTARKIRGFETHGSVLDIGPGEGYLSFYLADDPSIETYAGIEVTQSFYMLQTLIGHQAFGKAFRNHAVDPAPYPPMHVDRPETDAGETLEDLMVAPPSGARGHLYPWWRAPAAFERTYDVIMSNENVCEMSSTAFAYYADRIAQCLSPEGVFLIQGIGKTVDPKIMVGRLEQLAARGFRSYILGTTAMPDHPLHTPNFVLVPPGNRHHDAAPAQIMTLRFDAGDPVVRSVYGLDHPPGDITTHADLAGAVGEILGDY